MQLTYRQFGETATARPAVVLLHGLLGSSVNWYGIATRLSQIGHGVVVPDLRNHGRSPHYAAMDYPSMAADILRLLDALQLEQAILVGHSMGAKVAMWLALTAPERVEKVVAVDMVPLRSPNRFEKILESLLSLNLAQLESRTAADRHLADTLESQSLRDYLLQNLVRDEGGWRWRVNLMGLTSAIETLLDFPAVPAGTQFQGDALFLYGGNSDYVTPEAGPTIRELFPFSRLRPVVGAGHWVYAERPDEFLSALLPFLA